MSKRTHVLDPVASRRATAGSIVRTIYFCLIIGLGIVLSWQVVRPLIYTEGPGRVLAPRYVTSTPYNARVVGIYVKPGQTVKAGSILARVRSPDVHAMLANLTSALAAQDNAISDHRVQLAVAEAILPAAERRAASAEQNARKLGDKGCVATSLFCAEIVREQALAAVMLAQTRAEIKEITAELGRIEQGQARIQKIYDDVKSSYNDGEQLSRTSGIVGTDIVNPGQSVVSGQPIVEVLDTSLHYIEWVMDPSRVRQPKERDPVYIIDGSRIIRGEVWEILPISDTGQSNSVFKPSVSGQVVQILLKPGETYPPMLTNVEVRYNYWRFLDLPVEMYVQSMEWLGLWIQ